MSRAPTPHPLAWIGLTVVAALAGTPMPGAELAAQEPAPDTLTVLPVDSLTITVLRDRSPERLSPYAVATAGPEELRRGRTGAFLEEALGLLPGVQVQNRFNYAVGERIAVRGFGPRAQFGVRGMTVLVDGVPATMPDGQSTVDHLDLASLGRVEVLRGPASALYGNAAGGVVAFRTALPARGPVRPELRTVTGSHGLVNVTGGAEGWIGSTPVVVSAARLSFDGFRADPTAAADPTEETAPYGSADRSLLNARAVTPLAGGSLATTLNAVALDAENPGSLPRDALDDPARPAWGFNVRQGTGKEVDQAQLGAVWEGPAAGGRAEAAAWGLGRSVLNPIPPSVIDLSRRAGGVRLLWAGDPGRPGGASGPERPAFGWGGGLEWSLMRDERKNFENDGGAAGALTLDQVERVRATGGFLRGVVRPRPSLELSGALRYDRFRFEADDRFTDGDPDDSGSRTMDGWSPSVGVVWSPSGAIALWSNVATAIETPTTTELVNRPSGAGGFNPGLEPQRSTGLEAGARGSVGGRLSWEVAAFHVEIDDELVPFEVPEAPGRSFFRNAGASEHEGVEVSLDADLGAGVGARLVYERVDARFERYVVDGSDFSGNRVPGLAPTRFQGQIDGERGAWYWAVEGEWADEVPVDDANTESADAYWLWNVRSGVGGIAAGRVVLSLFGGVSNLFDERYTASITPNAFGGRFYEPGPGRTVHVGARVAWDRR